MLDAIFGKAAIVDVGVLPDMVAASAAEGDAPTVFEWLDQDSKAHIDAKFDSPDGTVQSATLLMMACGCGHEKLALQLIERGANINLQNSYGGCALMGAAAEGHVNILRALVKAKATLTLVDANGDTALALATKNEKTDCMEVLSGKA